MFTGIVENFGEIKAINKVNSNLKFEIQASFVNELKIDQSIAHNGICLTVTDLSDSCYCVTAVEETIKKTNIAGWKIGESINLERCMSINARFDGHIVQGHIDLVAECINIVDRDGSWIFTFRYSNVDYLTIEKGSITINGVSLTVINSQNQIFSVTIIPYTYQNTNFKFLAIGDLVNLEFDVIGKYVKKYLEASLIN